MPEAAYSVTRTTTRQRQPMADPCATGAPGDKGAGASRGAVHDFNVTVHSGRDGFETVKRIAGAVCASLIDAPLALASGHLVALRFLAAKAERGRAPEKRKVSLRFRAVVDQNI